MRCIVPFFCVSLAIYRIYRTLSFCLAQLVTEYYLTKNPESSFPVYKYDPFEKEHGEKVVKFIDKNVKW